MDTNDRDDREIMNAPPFFPSFSFFHLSIDLSIYIYIYADLCTSLFNNLAAYLRAP